MALGRRPLESGASDRVARALQVLHFTCPRARRAGGVPAWARFQADRIELLKMLIRSSDRSVVTHGLLVGPGRVSITASPGVRPCQDTARPIKLPQRHRAGEERPAGQASRPRAEKLGTVKTSALTAVVQRGSRQSAGPALAALQRSSRRLQSLYCCSALFLLFAARAPPPRRAGQPKSVQVASR